MWEISTKNVKYIKHLIISLISVIIWLSVIKDNIEKLLNIYIYKTLYKNTNHIYSSRMNSCNLRTLTRVKSTNTAQILNLKALLMSNN